MLALGVLALACLADAPLVARIGGGVFQDFAPSPFHLQHVLGPLLARMGAPVALELVRPGYVPGGSGLLELRVEPAPNGLAALELLEPGPVRSVRGIALASHLAERRVAARMAESCTAALAERGLAAKIDTQDDTEARQAGASLAIWTQTRSGCRLGADRAGAPRRSSEAIGRFAAKALLEDLDSGATTDRHLADQLVLFAALAEGRSTFSVPRVSDHVESNLWLAGLFGARTKLSGRELEIDGIGLATPKARRTG
jgi:RNA 3'-terminal phosphate cyclase (ATP)